MAEVGRLAAQQVQSQSQKQIQKLSQVQIQGINFLEMDSLDLRNEILKAVNENPALKIVSDTYTAKKNSEASDAYQKAIESTADYDETLQEHLLHQLNSMNLSEDEYLVSEKLIYNLDENGLYGSRLAPEFLLDPTRTFQTPALLQKCISLVQQMDPVGTCCKTPEESLYVQAKIRGDASDLTLFLLDGHLEFLNPPEPSKVIKKLQDFQNEWHSKAFAPQLIIDEIELSVDEVNKAVKYILSLNPRPAQGFVVDSSADYNRPDVVVSITKVQGRLVENDYSRGLVTGDEKVHFQVKYASGVLPEVKVDENFLKEADSSAEVKNYRRECILKASEFVSNLKFRESTVVLQACAIVQAQKAFFMTGRGSLAVLTRRQIAKEIGIHESSVSRTSNKRNSKYFQTEYGLFPASYFFTSGVSDVSGSQKVSADFIKQEIKSLLANSIESLSDAKITDMLNNSGISISRRTVAKYRLQLGIANSFER